MNKRLLVRIQVLLLLILVVWVLVRVIRGPVAPPGLVVLNDLRVRDLSHAAFALDAEAQVAVQARGSVVADAPTALATRAWIVRRADREVVWRMQADSVEHIRGTLVKAPSDTFYLAAGAYDVWFSSFGPQSFQQSKWRQDAKRWLFAVNVVDGAYGARRLQRDDVEGSFADSDLVWKAAPLRNNAERTYFFEAKRPTTLNVYAVGDVGSDLDEGPKDYSWIEDAVNGRMVWQLSKDNSEPAGGIPGNRIFSGAIMLGPGIYRAGARTDGNHGFRAWRYSPPDDPASWGLTLRSADPSAISEFDPWVSQRPLISFTGVGDDALLLERFQVTTRTPVVIYAVGEITGRGNEWDYGELFEDGPARRESVWKMSWDGSVHAGGSSKNRMETVFLVLEPGMYSLRYETDGSHSPDDWNADPPDYPERWGVTLFPMTDSLATGSVRLLEGVADENANDASSMPIAVVDPGDAIVNWTGLRGGVEERHAFSLRESGQLHIVALGEMSFSRRYDYGWITRIDSGETAWDMTTDNTVHAGGSPHNRRFDGVVNFEAGDYMVHFITDGEHHFGDFDAGAPDRPMEWGISIQYTATDGAE